MQKWEYAAMFLKEAVPTGELGAFGADGWELVSVCAFSGVLYAYFKRPCGVTGKVVKDGDVLHTESEVTIP